MLLRRISKKGIWFAAWLILAPIFQGVADDAPPEVVKALYIINLRKFVSLGNPSHPIRKICYYEKAGTPLNESVGQIITKYLEKNPQPGTPLSVQWFKAIRDFSGCDVFYIPAEEEANIPSILAALDTSSTLIVSAAPQFIFKGGMIGFTVDESDHIKMVANIKNSKAHGVSIDAQILEIMPQVIQ